MQIKTSESESIIIIIIIEHKVSFHSIFFLFYIFSASQLIVNCCVNNTTFATSFQSTQTFRCRRPFWAFENMSPHLCTCGPYFAVAPITFDVIIILVVVAKTLKGDICPQHSGQWLILKSERIHCVKLIIRQSLIFLISRCHADQEPSM